MDSTAHDATTTSTPDKQALTSSPPSSESESTSREQAVGVYESAAQAKISNYLCQRSHDFRVLSDLRDQGWKSHEADRKFAKPRSKGYAQDCYKKMQKLGRELDSATKAFHTPESRWYSARILDFCMAPGGFLKTIMDINKFSSATAFTLPVSSGGLQRLLPEHSKLAVTELDVTLLAGDMGMSADEIPPDHADASRFLVEKHLDTTDLFDLVICDGHIPWDGHHSPQADTRKHDRRPERCLKATQLALGLQHIKPGGTMVVLCLHADALRTIKLLHQFDKFATIELFKPTAMHQTRSSFYLVAKEIRPDHPDFAAAIQAFREMWRVGTFGSDEEVDLMVQREEEGVDALLEEFGQTLIALATGVWSKQAEALKAAPWMRSAKQGETLGEDGGKEERCV